MPSNEATPGRTDPALKEALDAFDGATLPPPPITKVTNLTPAEGLEALRSLEEYLDRVGDPVVSAVRLILSNLSGQSFATPEETKEFARRVQSILDRTGYTVVCPKCSEPGRLDAVSHPGRATGVYRVRHGTDTHGGSGAITDFTITREERGE
jgi:hypothetical protein